MKILHLNTHSYGGAAVVARRLHLAALASGVDSRFVTKYGLRSDATPRYQPLRNARVLYSLRDAAQDPRWYRIGKYVQRRMQHRNLVNRPAGFEIFSPLNTADNFSDCAAPADPEVVHLHWIAGFVDNEGFFEKNRDRNFVWTLHDMNPFTGGCHHADECTAFSNGCAVCPQLRGTIDQAYSSAVFAAKANALRALRDDQLTIVAPSRWMLELSARSPILARFRHVYIPNPSIEPYTADASALRRALGLPADKKIVLFVSANLRNHRKDIPILFEAARLLPDRHQIHLVGVGQRTDSPGGLSTSFTGAISDERLLAQYFACADVLVNSSPVENSPLTVIEALTCGTPVVAFKVGGIPELVGREDGALAAQRSPQALADALDDVLFRRVFDRAAIRERAERHAPLQVLAQYQQIYETLVAN
jgi:glycosyltransferase involved in cell wall biosynthesis